MDRKIKDSAIAEKITAIAEKDVNLAAEVVDSIKDVEAKIFGLINLYNFSKDAKFLKQALSLAKEDEDFLRIIEYSESVSELLNLPERIKNQYRKDIAYSTLLEKTEDLNLIPRIKNSRILSATLKRVALRKKYPENLSIARIIPEPYYRALALIEVSKREAIDLRKEIDDAVQQIKSHTLRRRLRGKY